MALNMKGVPYRTVWIECADIESHCISIGAAPTSYNVDAVDGTKTPFYTFPVIQDPNTGAIVSDSFKIAVYLDKTYTSGPVLVPAGAGGLLAAFQDTLGEKIESTLMPLLILEVRKQIPVKSSDWWLRTREERFGIKLEDVVPVEQRPVVWEKVKAAFGQVGQWMDATGGGGQYVMGDKLSWADVQIETWLSVAWIIWGDEKGKWKELMSIDGGRWKKFFEANKRWVYVDEDGVAALGALGPW